MLMTIPFVRNPSAKIFCPRSSGPSHMSLALSVSTKYLESQITERNHRQTVSKLILPLEHLIASKVPHIKTKTVSSTSHNAVKSGNAFTSSYFTQNPHPPPPSLHLPPFIIYPSTIIETSTTDTNKSPQAHLPNTTPIHSQKFPNRNQTSINPPKPGSAMTKTFHFVCCGCAYPNPDSHCPRCTHCGHLQHGWVILWLEGLCPAYKVWRREKREK